jgi:hypothetical protein
MSINRRFHARNARFYILTANVAFVLIFSDSGNTDEDEREQAQGHG